MFPNRDDFPETELTQELLDKVHPLHQRIHRRVECQHSYGSSNCIELLPVARSYEYDEMSEEGMRRISMINKGLSCSSACQSVQMSFGHLSYLRMTLK